MERVQKENKNWICDGCGVEYIIRGKKRGVCQECREQKKKLKAGNVNLLED